MKRLIRSKNTYLILVTECLLLLFVLSCIDQKAPDKADLIVLSESNSSAKAQLKILPAADLMNAYLPFLKGKKIAVVANQTSVVSAGALSAPASYTHLIDTLLSHGINIEKVFAPEHGFRGAMDAGAHVEDDIDIKTGLPIISLHGKNRKPTPEQLQGLDLVVFDIQDVGVRFYTYISTLSLLMEACAAQEMMVMVLDRPNPNGYYVDGPVLEAAYSSFVGMHEVPLVYGMTIGEYALMVNGEGWLKDSLVCNLKVVPSLNYTHKSRYSLPIRPSPNLPNDKAINLYPSLGFFEGTIINAGRGTEFQFQRYGAPFFPVGAFSYTPVANFGAKQPKFKGEKCYGVDLSNQEEQDRVNVAWLVDAYHKTPKDKDFFGETFTIHAGNEELRKQIEAGMDADAIRETWTSDLEAFQLIREKYLLYP